MSLLMFALLVIRWFRPGPESPGFRWKPSVDGLCKSQQNEVETCPKAGKHALLGILARQREPNKLHYGC